MLTLETWRPAIERIVYGRVSVGVRCIVNENVYDEGRIRKSSLGELGYGGNLRTGGAESVGVERRLPFVQMVRVKDATLCSTVRPCCSTQFDTAIDPE